MPTNTMLDRSRGDGLRIADRCVQDVPRRNAQRQKPGIMNLQPVRMQVQKHVPAPLLRERLPVTALSSPCRLVRPERWSVGYKRPSISPSSLRIAAGGVDTQGRYLG